MAEPWAQDLLAAVGAYRGPATSSPAPAGGSDTWSLAQRTAQRHGLDPSLLAGVWDFESGNLISGGLNIQYEGLRKPFEVYPGVVVPAGINFSGGAAGSITSAGGPNVSIVGSDEAVAISNRTSAMIDIAQVQGQVHAQSVQKVGELADRNPNETVAIIRGWLHEKAA